MKNYHELFNHKFIWPLFIYLTLFMQIQNTFTNICIYILTDTNVICINKYTQLKMENRLFCLKSEHQYY